MRTAGRAVGSVALAALIWAAAYFGIRELAAFSYRFSLQLVAPAVLITALVLLLAAWSSNRDDPTGWMVVLAVLAVVMLIAHGHLLDVRALRDHGLEQHARVTRVTTEFDANNSSYPRLTLEALDGPPLTGTVDGNLGSSFRVGQTVTVTTDPVGHVGPQLGTLPGAANQRWTIWIDDTTGALMVVPLTGWAIDRIRKHLATARKSPAAEQS
ncbi:hypothetical protein [Kitasatospora sp. CB01950]|uniref:hypothetical protein n=1 Tax=Kitasatospora sp. CB01950 TaxID=1703930 RepID=UPI001161296A|nr:hypothetical protein [Kitasatospora sp. CB01950]